MKAGRVCFSGMLLIVLLAAAIAASSSNDATVAGMERKLQHVEKNGAAAKPDPTPTEFSEQEINAYFAAGKVDLPEGVKSVSFQLQPGLVTATTHVDFDQLKQGRSSANPMLGVFSGVHDVVVSAQAYGASGVGVVHVESVVLDGVEIPRFVLELFVENFIQPKYPQAGLDSHFALPDKINSATVGSHKVTVIQR